MSRKQIIGYVLLSLVIVAALAVGGYALYRLGYSHGMREVSQLPFEKRLIPDFPHRSLPRIWDHRGYMGFPLLFAFPGLLLTLGVIALVVLAIIGIIKLVQPNRRMREPLPESKTSPSIPADEDSTSSP